LSKRKKQRRRLQATWSRLDRRFDVQNRVLSPFTPTDFLQSGTASLGKRIACYAALDGTDTYDVVLLNSHLSTVCQEMVVLV